MPSLRDQRLREDYRRLQELVRVNADLVQIEAVTDCPARQYEIALHCRSVVNFRRGNPVYGDVHRVSIVLTAGYPLRAAPCAKVLTPIRHPHVFPTTKDVCLGNERSVSEFLDAFVCRLYDILRYDPRYLDTRSPADADAMTWACQSMHMFPLDARRLVHVGAAPKRPPIVWRNK